MEDGISDIQWNPVKCEFSLPFTIGLSQIFKTPPPPHNHSPPNILHSQPSPISPSCLCTYSNMCPCSTSIYTGNWISMALHAVGMGRQCNTLMRRRQQTKRETAPSSPLPAPHLLSSFFFLPIHLHPPPFLVTVPKKPCLHFPRDTSLDTLPQWKTLGSESDTEPTISTTMLCFLVRFCTVLHFLLCHTAFSSLGSGKRAITALISLEGTSPPFCHELKPHFYRLFQTRLSHFLKSVFALIRA